MTYRRTSLGDSASSLLKQATPALQIGYNLIKDPYLPELACEIQRLSLIDEGKPPGPPCARTDEKYRYSVGAGLRHGVGPLRLFVTHKQYPWALPLAAAGAIGLIYLMGYSVGRARNRKPTP